ncbi:MAG: cell division protein FtsA [Bacilli bacterium]|nr:cell division protein FtsA [Bacilli bacterium]
MKNIFTSIDIGSNNIKVVVCELHNNKLNLLAASSVSSKGIKRGMIVNADEASKSIKEAFEKVESMLGIKIKKVIASIPSYFAEFTYIKGTVNVVNEENLIGSDEVVDVLGVAMESKLTNDKEMVTIIPVDFKVDDKGGISNPLGHSGKLLSARAIMVTTPKKNIYSVVSVLENLGIEVIDIMINGIGNIYSLKTRDMSDLVGAVIDIGSETATVSLYNKTVIVKNSIIGVGSKVLDNDLAFTYKIGKDDAKKIKETFALASKKYASVGDFYEVKNELGEDIKINQFEATEVVTNRLDEILELVKNEILSLSGRELDYIVFTGGMSEMTHFELLINEKFGKKATVGKIRTIGVRNNIYSASLGNIIYFVNKLKLKGKNYSMVSTKDSEDLSSVKKNNANLVSDSMLGKVAQYFFGE